MQVFPRIFSSKIQLIYNAFSLLIQKYKTLCDFPTSKVRNYSIDSAFVGLYLCGRIEAAWLMLSLSSSLTLENITCLLFFLT